MKALLIAASAAALLLGGGALAQEGGVEEIVVTGSRLMDYDQGGTPHVVLKRRADNIITTVTVTCDTRDPAQRKAELLATIRAMVRSAGAAGVELGVSDDDVVGRFDAARVEGMIRPGGKPDTSLLQLTLKTKVGPADTFESATKRVEAFVENTPMTGRTEIIESGDWDLTLIGPERYRAEIISLIAADARRTAAVFGDDYGVGIDGLSLPVTWYQSGPLELALYIPYRQSIGRK